MTELLEDLTDAELLDDLAVHDGLGRPVDPGGGLEEDGDERGALWVLRRGLATSPELRAGLAFTAAMALASAVGRLTIPVLVQQVVQRGVIDADGFDRRFIAGACLVTVVVIGAVAVVSRATYIRLVTAAEAMLFRLRTQAFAHVHALSIADHDDHRRGELTARVTSDIEIIARFAQWAGVAWIVNTVVIAGTLVVMAAYSWQLTLVTVVVFVPIIPAMRFFQRRQLAAYGRVRDQVGGTMTEVSEAVMGAAVIRAYGVEERTRARLEAAIDRQYRAEMTAARYFALMFPLSDLFGGLTLTAVVAAGAVYGGSSWGLDVGTVLAFVFLVNLILGPVAELGEILDQTQQGLAGWRRVFLLLDQPVDVPEPDPGRPLPRGALAVTAEGVRFSYRGGPPVLSDLDVTIPAGASVAVVGETGSGKTTFAKLLCRFADPTRGRITVGGADLREVAKADRNRAIRLVPQDGFLFDTTVGENIRQGRPGATDADVAAALASLGLAGWAAGLPQGLATQVGERGENLSVGERQLVALVRAQLADPGLLVLDEATSAVDPETERVLGDALRRLAEGRTTISVAHRLSTAESADLVLVFDGGRLVEEGTHAELVAAGGTYAALYESWLGNTRTA